MEEHFDVVCYVSNNIYFNILVGYLGNFIHDCSEPVVWIFYNNFKKSLPWTSAPLDNILASKYAIK